MVGVVLIKMGGYLDLVLDKCRSTLLKIISNIGIKLNLIQNLIMQEEFIIKLL
jgi:hypothetical protein